MAAIETIKADQFPAWLQEVAREAMFRSWSKTLQKIKVMLVASIKENFAGSHAPDGTPWKRLAHPRPGSRGKDKPLRDTGVLMASSTARGPGHVERFTDFTFEFGSNLDRAATHQHGAIIRPRRGKYLSIPLTREAKRAGGASKFPRQLFAILSRKGNLFLAERVLVGKRKQPKLSLQYILVKQVRVPARPSVGWSEKLADRAATIVADDLRGRAAGG